MAVRIFVLSIDRIGNGKDSFIRYGLIFLLPVFGLLDATHRLDADIILAAEVEEQQTEDST